MVAISRAGFLHIGAVQVCVCVCAKRMASEGIGQTVSMCSAGRCLARPLALDPFDGSLLRRFGRPLAVAPLDAEAPVTRRRVVKPAVGAVWEGQRAETLQALGQ